MGDLRNFFRYSGDPSELKDEKENLETLVNLNSIAYEKEVYLYKRHWKVFHTEMCEDAKYQSHGFRGYALLNRKEKIVIFVNSGTKIHPEYQTIVNTTDEAEIHRDNRDLMLDVINDLQLFLHDIPYQFRDVNGFTKVILREIKNEFGGEELKDFKFLCTGHSLGAVLADMQKILITLLLKKPDLLNDHEFSDENTSDNNYKLDTTGPVSPRKLELPDTEKSTKTSPDIAKQKQEKRLREKEEKKLGSKSSDSNNPLDRNNSEEENQEDNSNDLTNPPKVLRDNSNLINTQDSQTSSPVFSNSVVRNDPSWSEPNQAEFSNGIQANNSMATTNPQNSDDEEKIEDNYDNSELILVDEGREYNHQNVEDFGEETATPPQTPNPDRTNMQQNPSDYSIDTTVTQQPQQLVDSPPDMQLDQAENAEELPRQDNLSDSAICARHVDEPEEVSPIHTVTPERPLYERNQDSLRLSRTSSSKTSSRTNSKLSETPENAREEPNFDNIQRSLSFTKENEEPGESPIFNALSNKDENLEREARVISATIEHPGDKSTLALIFTNPGKFLAENNENVKDFNHIRTSIRDLNPNEFIIFNSEPNVINTSQKHLSRPIILKEGDSLTTHASTDDDSQQNDKEFVIKSSELEPPKIFEAAKNHKLSDISRILKSNNCYIITYDEIPSSPICTRFRDSIFMSIEYLKTAENCFGCQIVNFNKLIKVWHNMARPTLSIGMNIHGKYHLAKNYVSQYNKTIEDSFKICENTEQQLTQPNKTLINTSLQISKTIYMHSIDTAKEGFRLIKDKVKETVSSYFGKIFASVVITYSLASTIIESTKNFPELVYEKLFGSKSNSDNFFDKFDLYGVEESKESDESTQSSLSGEIEEQFDACAQ